MREQLRMFGPAGAPCVAPAGPAGSPRAVQPVAGRRYRLPLDLARWVRDEAEAQGTTADAIVAVAVAQLQQNSIWGGGE